MIERMHGIEEHASNSIYYNPADLHSSNINTGMHPCGPRYYHFSARIYNSEDLTNDTDPADVLHASQGKLKHAC